MIRLIRQIVVLCLIYWGCHWFVARTGFPLPANVLGMALLFGLLLSGRVKEEQLSEGAGMLLKHLPFFFIPIAVGVMDMTDIFYRHGAAILVALVVSSVLPFVAVNPVAQMLQKRRKSCRK